GAGRPRWPEHWLRNLGCRCSPRTVKEALCDVLGASTIDASAELGRAAVRVLLAMARENGCGVLESNCRTSISRDELRSLPGRILEGSATAIQRSAASASLIDFATPGTLIATASMVSLFGVPRHVHPSLVAGLWCAPTRFRRSILRR